MQDKKKYFFNPIFGIKYVNSIIFFLQYIICNLIQAVLLVKITENKSYISISTSLIMNLKFKNKMAAYEGHTQFCYFLNLISAMKMVSNWMISAGLSAHTIDLT